MVKSSHEATSSPVKPIGLVTLVGKSIVTSGNTERICFHYLEEPEKDPCNSQVTPELVIDSLSTYKVRARGAYSMCHFSCDICQHRYRIGDYVTSLPCQHKFHNYCIENWLRWVRSSCPVDKKPVTRVHPPAADEEDQDSMTQEEDSQNLSAFMMQNRYLGEGTAHQFAYDSPKRFHIASNNQYKKTGTFEKERHTATFAEKTVFEDKSSCSECNSAKTKTRNQPSSKNSLQKHKSVEAQEPEVMHNASKSLSEIKKHPTNRSVLTTVPRVKMSHSVSTADKAKRQQLAKTIEDLRLKLTDDSILETRRHKREDYFKGSYNDSKGWKKSMTDDYSTSGGDTGNTLNRNQAMTLQDIVALKTRTFGTMLPSTKALRSSWIRKYNLKIPREKMQS